MEKKKNIWVGKIVVIVLIIVSIGSYYVFPSVKHVMNQVFKMFASGDFAVVRDFVASYGAYAALISFLLMIFQSIAAPLPAFLITFANANLFGWWQELFCHGAVRWQEQRYAFSLQEYLDVMWQKSLRVKLECSR